MPIPIKTIADFTFDSYLNESVGGRTEPFIVATPNGGFQIVGTDNFTGKDVESRLYDGFGALSGDGSNLSENGGAKTSRQGSVAYLEDGRFVAVWETEPEPFAGNVRDVRAEVYFADGTIQKADFLVAGGVGNQMTAVVAASPDGGFAIAYNDFNVTERVIMKVYDQAGDLDTTVDPVNTAAEIYNIS